MSLENFVLISLVGVLATYAHLIMALWAPSIGLPRIDFAAGMADITWGESFEGKAPYWMGFTMIHMNGVLFALMYSGFVGGYLPGPDVVKGILWGGILFIGAQFFFVPFFLKGGFFGLKHGKMGWVTALMVHGIYGAIVGWLCPVLA